MKFQRSKEDNFLLLFLVVLCLYHIIARFGLAVDLQWHTDVGRDKLFTPPHIMILAGIIPTSIMLSSYIFWYSFISNQEEKVGFYIGPFIAPTSLWMMVCGLITLVLGGLYDDFWHTSYGIDTTIITPPHVWTFAGGMLVEVATIALALQMKNRLKDNCPKWLNLIILGTLWALVYHFHLAFANFLDPRVWSFEILNINIILHFIFAGATLMIFLPLADRWLGKNGAISLSGLLLGSQLLFLILVPFLVSTFMTSEHFFRPGSPHTTWAAHCLPWLLLPGLLFVKKFSSLENPNSMIALVILADVVWLPTFIDYIPQEVGIFDTFVSVVFSVAILRVFWQLSLGFGASVERLSLDKQISLSKSKSKNSKLSVLGIVMMILFLPVVSGHTIHFSEEGEGFDAPKRYLIDIDDKYVWVEFMMWPPKAITDIEVIVLPAENETAVIDEVWIEVVYPNENGEVRMRTDMENRNDISIWSGQLNFPFSGNQSLEIWLEVDGETNFTTIPVEVEGPPVLPVWLAWLLAISWPALMVLIWRNISHKIS
ncbi:MAG: hypothetical protein ACJZ5B_05090 [Candidatus Poseidoniaceae archaeon]|tara:strand:+ start:2531 stop:4153 length:1623 start_codon:yes stop_codon:yes gene_type:complete